jgi:DNA repair protein RadC
MQGKRGNELMEVKVSYSTRGKVVDNLIITHAKDAYTILLGLWDMDNIEYIEEMYVLLLNRKNKLIGYTPLSKGGMSGTVVDLKVLFALLLKSASAGFIIAHNHPSGNLKPSGADIELTRKVSEVSKLLDISMLDHLVVTLEGYYSFADEGML